MSSLDDLAKVLTFLKQAPRDMMTGPLHDALEELLRAQRHITASDVITRAAALKTDEPAREQRPPRMFGPTAASRWRTAELIELLTPSVVQIRRDLFGTERAPQRTLRAATQWIESELRQAGAAATVTTLPPWGEGLEVRHVPPTSTIARFFRLVTQLCQASGFSGGAVARWILADQAPVLPAARIASGLESHRLPDGRFPSRETVLVQLLVPFVGEPTFRELYRRTRDRWRLGAAARAVRQRDVLLKEAVKDAGGPPSPRTNLRFWTAIKQVMERGGAVHRTPRAYQKAYERLMAGRRPAQRRKDRRR
jgi:hypothetical protein